MAKTPEAVRDAVRAYVARFDRVTVVLPAGSKDIIRNQIGWNPGPYINELVRRDFASKNLPFDAGSCPEKSENVRSGAVKTKPMYRSELEQISILLPPGTKDLIKTVLGQKCSPYLATLVEKDFQERGIDADFSALRHKKAPTVFTEKPEHLPIEQVSRLYLSGYSNKQIAGKLSADEVGNQVWTCDEVESIWRYADFQVSDNPELNDLIEAVQIEKQRRRRFAKEHGLIAYSGNTEENPLDDKLFFAENQKPFRKSTRGDFTYWTYNNRADINGLKILDRLEISNEIITRRIVNAWQSLADDSSTVWQWEDAIKGPNPYKAFQSSRMIDLAARVKADPEAPIKDVLMMVEHVDINRDGSYTIEFLDGSTVNPAV